MKIRTFACLLSILVLAAPFLSRSPPAATNSAPVREGILTAGDVGNKLIAGESVFPRQITQAGSLRVGFGMRTDFGLAGLVDSSAIRLAYGRSINFI
jgi:hypothetical protein